MLRTIFVNFKYKTAFRNVLMFSHNKYSTQSCRNNINISEHNVLGDAMSTRKRQMVSKICLLLNVSENRAISLACNNEVFQKISINHFVQNMQALTDANVTQTLILEYAHILLTSKTGKSKIFKNFKI